MASYNLIHVTVSLYDTNKSMYQNNNLDFQKMTHQFHLTNDITIIKSDTETILIEV